MGTKYVEGRSIEFAKSYEESAPSIPVFFILSPGVDPLKDVEALGKKLGFTSDNNNFHNISLGQGQEVVAERAMAISAKEGQWVVLQVCLAGITSCLSVCAAPPPPPPPPHLLSDSVVRPGQSLCESTYEIAYCI